MSDETVPKKKAKGRRDFKSELTSLRNRVTTAVMLLKRIPCEQGSHDGAMVNVALELLEGTD